MHLPENSISSWADLCHEFIGAFTGGHQETGRPSDLQLLQQKERETLRKYLQRFSKVHRNIPNIHPAAVIAAFQSNVRNRRIRFKVNVRFPKTMKELYTLWISVLGWRREGSCPERKIAPMSIQRMMMNQPVRRTTRSAVRSGMIRQ